VVKESTEVAGRIDGRALILMSAVSMKIDPT
jgi:hypothetical protein